MVRYSETVHNKVCRRVDIRRAAIARGLVRWSALSLASRFTAMFEPSLNGTILLSPGFDCFPSIEILRVLVGVKLPPVWEKINKLVNKR